MRFHTVLEISHVLTEEIQTVQCIALTLQPLPYVIETFRLGSNLRGGKNAACTIEELAQVFPLIWMV